MISVLVNILIVSWISLLLSGICYSCLLLPSILHNKNHHKKIIFVILSHSTSIIQHDRLSQSSLLLLLVLTINTRLLCQQDTGNISYFSEVQVARRGYFPKYSRIIYYNLIGLSHAMCLGLGMLQMSRDWRVIWMSVRNSWSIYRSFECLAPLALTMDIMYRVSSLTYRHCIHTIVFSPFIGYPLAITIALDLPLTLHTEPRLQVLSHWLPHGNPQYLSMELSVPVLINRETPCIYWLKEVFPPALKHPVSLLKETSVSTYLSI